MGYIIISLIWIVVPFAAATGWHLAALDSWRRQDNDLRRRGAVIDLPPKPKFELALALGVSAGLFLAYTAWASFVVVPAGHVGVRVTFGTVSQETLTEGAHFINPTSSVKDVEVRVVTTQLKGSSAGTKDLQQVHTDIVLNYRLDGAKAAHIYKEYGLNLEDRIVLPALNESFKATTAHYSSEELITKRDEVSTKIREEIAQKLGKYSVEVGDISLVNFGFSAEYQKAIEAKVIATQSKLQAEQDLARIEVEAKQAVAKAEGRAKAIQIETAAINSQGGASYVQLKAIEKWDGKLPTTQAGGATPFINVK
jgi:regulator of protease activity HflC (stomatin/prohibitin superfamily)